MMQSLDLDVLRDALNWRRAGHAVTLFTVLQTWGSAPRQAGAMLAIRADGVLSGSVSGGCVEEDLIARINATGVAGARSEKPALIIYGASLEETNRFGLPCGGTLRLLQEPLLDSDWVAQLLNRTAAHELVVRSVTLATGAVHLSTALAGQPLTFDGTTLCMVFGPQWRMLLIGAGQLSQAVARISVMLDFSVLVCDPREEYAAPLLEELPGVRRLAGMPDEAVRVLLPDSRTAILALTHDSKLDDMALLEALQSDAFYVGALGSKRNQAARKQRLAHHFDLTAEQLARLHGPVGLTLGARTPAEIAVAIVAEIIQVKNSAAATTPSTVSCETP